MRFSSNPSVQRERLAETLELVMVPCSLSVIGFAEWAEEYQSS